jgi:hypothetical protein
VLYSQCECLCHFFFEKGGYLDHAEYYSDILACHFENSKWFQFHKGEIAITAIMQ